MEGKHKIEVRSGRVVFTIEQEHYDSAREQCYRKNNAGGDATSIRDLRQTEQRNSEL